MKTANEINASSLSERLLHNAGVLLGREYPDSRFDHAPSAVPFGRIRCSVFDPQGRLWAVCPEREFLICADVFRGEISDESARLRPGAKIAALFCEAGRVVALADGKFFHIADAPAPDGAGYRPPRQRIPFYYAAGDCRIPAEVRAGFSVSAEFEPTPFLAALGDVRAAVSRENELYVGTGLGLMYFYKREDGSCAAEVFSGGRYLFENDCAVTGVFAGEDGVLWIENSRGAVKIERPFVRLSEKAASYRAVTAALHGARGSICDIHYEAIDSGNAGFLPLRRYSTNNDALWALLDAIADGMRYEVLLAEGDGEGAQAAAEDMRRILENVLLQSRIHGRGDGFVCRGYVSIKDRDFVKDGQITENGLWFRKGRLDGQGRPAAVVEDTPAARLGEDIPNGKRHLLTPEVRARFENPGNTPADGEFRLSCPAGDPVPPRLAALYENPDPVWPEIFPACGDGDIIYKADTSSEEVIAAYVMYYFAWKHLLKSPKSPGDAELLELVKENAAATITHLLDNGYRLIDAHGNPTQWGKWHADYFKFPFSDLPEDKRDYSTEWRHPDYAFTDAALNSAEIMCMFKVTMELLRGDKRYRAVYDRVLGEYDRCFGEFDPEVNGAGYVSHFAKYRENILALTEFHVKKGDYMLKRGLVPAHMRPEIEKKLKYFRTTLKNGDYTARINYSDEELAVLSFWPLLELEEDPARLGLIRAGFMEWWHNMRREANPIYTFAAAALLPDAQADLTAAADALYRLPWRLTQMPVQNSLRNDVVVSEGGEGPVLNRALPIDERRLHKSNSSPFTADFGGGQPRGYDRGYLYSGNIFTLPYWTARFYGLLDRDA